MRPAFPLPNTVYFLNQKLNTVVFFRINRNRLTLKTENEAIQYFFFAVEDGT